MKKLTREEIRKEINRRPLTDFYTLEKSKGNMYCCPVCNSGHGKNKTGALELKQHDGKWRARCFASDCFTEHGEDTLGALKIIWNMDETEVIKKCGFNIQEGSGRPTSFKYQLKEWNRAINEPDNEGLLYLKGRGISLETINKHGVGYAENWKHPTNNSKHESRRVILPATDFSYATRAIDPTEYLPKQKAKFNDEISVSYAFNINGIADTDEKVVFITEGEIDALSIIEAGGIAAATGSAAYTGEFIEALKEARIKNKHFVIAMDNDEAGKKATEKLEAALTEYNKSFKCKWTTINICGDNKDANDELTEHREAFIKRIDDIKTSPERYKNNEDKRTSNLVINMLKEIDENKNTPYITTGFNAVDEMTGGGLREGLYILMAGTGVGKTALALQIADNAAQSGARVLYYNLEMANAELMARSLSRHTYINALPAIKAGGTASKARTQDDILDGKKWDNADGTESAAYTQPIYDAMGDYSAYCDNILFTECFGFIAPEEIRRQVAYERKVNGRRNILVVLDYLQMLTIGTALKEKNAPEMRIAVDMTVAELKRISRDYNISVLALSATNRAANKANTEIDTEAGKESGGIEYTADCLLSLDYAAKGQNSYDRDAEEGRSTRKMKLKTLKNRHSAPRKYVLLDYVAEYHYFDITKHNDMNDEPARKIY